jgi:transcriptional regulator with GAF, ATPase, and Fis domain
MQEKLTEKLYAIIDLASLLANQNDFQEALRLITQKATDIVDADLALVMMLNPLTHQTVKTVFRGSKEISERKYHFLHTNISGWVIDNNRPFITDDIQTDLRFRKAIFKDTDIKSVIGMPIRIEAVLTGTLIMLNKSGSKSFSKDDLEILVKLADIASPFLNNVQKIQTYFNTPLSTQSLLKKYEIFGLLGKSKAFVELLQTIEAAARSPVRVLLEGESGTGKELIARAIHKNSNRSPNKFLAIDCGAIANHLIESELFGHVKGSFTGAISDRKGLLEEADGGTLFMDEITNLSFDMQAKILRVLQEGEVRPVGSNQMHKVDVRIITASSSPLKGLVEKQKFREDLFYRLNVYPIVVPTLNDRREDIPLLANSFLKKFSEQQNKKIESMHGIILDFIKQHNWPGNIRELENFIERLVTLTPDEMKIIEPSVLPNEYQQEVKKIKRTNEPHPVNRPLNVYLSEYEEKLIRNALINCQWNQSKTARTLQISEHALRYKMQKLGIKNRN